VVYTKPNLTLAELGHEMRHCFEGHWHRWSTLWFYFCVVRLKHRPWPLLLKPFGKKQQLSQWLSPEIQLHNPAFQLCIDATGKRASSLSHKKAPFGAFIFTLGLQTSWVLRPCW
jgi:hypothetical protein